MRWRGLVTVAVTGCLVAGACAGGDRSAGPDATEGVRIGAFDFDESRLVAELYATALEAEGLAVVRLGSVGPREIVAPALEQGLIDVVPEYLGTAVSYFGTSTTGADTTASRETLASLLAPRGLAPLEPAPAQDTNVVAVTAQRAAALDLSRISDLRPMAADLRFGGPVECPDRPLCLLGLRDVYQLEFADFVPMRSLHLTAAALERGDIDVGLFFSTSAELDDAGLVVLDDDRHLQPAENLVPVVRTAALDRWGPTLAATLDRVSANLTTEVLRELNGEVGDGRPVAEVASDWLALSTE